MKQRCPSLKTSADAVPVGRAGVECLGRRRGLLWTALGRIISGHSAVSALGGQAIGHPQPGFSLVEAMIAVSVFLLIVAGSINVYIMCQKFCCATSLDLETSQMASMALSKMINGVGTNAGIRQASSIAFYQYPTTTNDSAYVHSHLSPSTYKYWLISSTSAPKANDWRLDMTCTYQTYNDGGSWRLMFSNEFSGAQYMEYNCPYQTLSLGTSSQNRVLLATYVTNAVVATNEMGVNLTVVVARRVGNFVSTNSASAYVRLRNSL